MPEFKGRTTMAQTHAASGEVIKLQALGALISAHRTSALIKARQLELVRVVLRAGQSLREHSAPGEITVLCLEGTIEFTTPIVRHRLQAGDLIHLGPGEPHALLGLTDATALVTICLGAP
jgi:quercetin dioxygenase-like cupin family protein